MTPFKRLLPLWIACAMLLAACGTAPPQSRPALFDLGPAAPRAGAPSAARLPPLAVADIQAPSWLETPQMYYRLNYASANQPQPYSASRWATPPVQLFGHRLRTRLSQAGGAVLTVQDGAVDVPVLRIEADDFSQHFTAPGQSMALVTMRVSLFSGRTWLAQKSFSRQVPASTADAAGGAKALADASDAVIDDMVIWLSGLKLKT